MLNKNSQSELSALAFSIFAPSVFILISLLPPSRQIMADFTSLHPYIAGFVKFALLATAGELIAVGLAKKHFSIPPYFLARMLVWGFLGIIISLIFKLFFSGVSMLCAAGALPGGEYKLAIAFWTSFLMNSSFGPTMMAAHRVFDSWLDLKHSGANATYKSAIGAVDWPNFGSFVVAKTLPFFWIPAHTLVFLLPEHFRVLAAAFLSVALGALLAFATVKKN